MSLTPEQASQLPIFTTQNIAELTTAVTNTIGRSFEQLQLECRASRERESNTSKIKDAASVITRCDGMHNVDVREWMRAMEVAGTVTEGVPNNIHRLTRKTTAGALYRAVEEWVSTLGAGNVVTWNALRVFVSDRFLGTNELDRLRLEISKLKQGADSVLTFNRRFMEMGRIAYPLPRAADIERMLIRFYATALNDKDLAKKLIVESGANDLEAAMNYVDGLNAGTELFQSLYGDELMDCSAVRATPPVDFKKIVEQQNTKIAKLQAQLKETQNKKTKSTTIRCYYCNKPGHIKRDCKKRQRSSHNGPPRFQSGEPSPQAANGNPQGNHLNY